MRNVKKAAAIFGGIAALSVFAASAITAFAFEAVKLEERQDQLTAGKLNIVADEVYADAGETVSYTVWIANNSGYAELGLKLYYDAALTAVEEKTYYADLKTGKAATGLMTSDKLNVEKHLIGFSTLGNTNNETDGELYTVKFVVPDNAAVGTTYPITLAVDMLHDNRTDPVEYTTVNGWIKIREPETTTTVTTTTAPAIVVTTTNATTVTSVITTTSGSSVTTTATTSFGTDITTSISTKKTDRDPTAEVTTSAKQGGNSGGSSSGGSSSGGSSSTGGVKTGDPGMGAALAALTLAGLSAVIVGRKKEH